MTTIDASTAELVPVDARIARLNAASLRKVIEPEDAFDFAGIGSGQVLPDDLLSVAGLDLDLTADQRARLSREEAAAMLSMGVAFESVLDAGFSWQIATAKDLTDHRVRYMLHEIGEETRHSRAFIRIVEQLAPTATNPMDTPLLTWLNRRFLPVLITSPALLATMVLAGEEIPDLLQKLAADHPATDPVIAQVNRYHRTEEARHLAFARTTVGELHRDATRRERFLIRHLAPLLIDGLFGTFVHPGVYATVGLPTWPTWKAANRTPQRRAVKLAAVRPVLAALVGSGVFAPGRIPTGWRKLCQVDRHGQPLPGSPTLASVGVPAGLTPVGA